MLVPKYFNDIVLLILMNLYYLLCIKWCFRVQLHWGDNVVVNRSEASAAGAVE